MLGHIALASLAILLHPQPIHAQGGSLEPERNWATNNIPNSVRGHVREGDMVIGMAPGLRAYFTAGDVGIRVPGDPSPALRLSMLSVGREHGVSPTNHPASIVAPREDGPFVVTYPRDTCTERYTMREDGIEQSFVFDTLPPGDGDLVVRMRLTTVLERVDHPDLGGKLLFGDPDRGALQIGAVTGVDADGRTAPGDLHWADNILELRLPAGFVAGAQLPLVLDPLITGSLPLPNGVGQFAEELDIAYDASRDVFLVVWNECFSNASPGIVTLGSVVRPDGSLVPAARGTIVTCFECNSSLLSFSPSVVKLANRADLFVVSYVGNRGVSAVLNWAVTVSPSARFWSTSQLNLGLGSNPTIARLGANPTGGDDDIIVLWDDRSGPTPRVRATELELDAAGQLRLLGTVDLGTVRDPGNKKLPVSLALTKSSGMDGRHVAVWEHPSGDLTGAILDRSLNIIDQGRFGLGRGLSLPSVAGNGRQWLVTYQREPNTVACAPVFWDSNTASGLVGAERTLGTGTAPSIGMCGLLYPIPPWNTPIAPVAWAGESYLVAFHDAVSGDAVLHSLDEFTCAPCEGQFVLRSPSQTKPFPTVIASQRSGDPTQGDLAMISSERLGARIFRADDGITQDLGGGCGRGGYTAASCAIAGNTGFALRLRDARPGVAAFAVLGVQAGGFACGSCTLRIDLQGAVIVPVSVTDGEGNASLPLPLPGSPSVVGATIVTQWVTAGGNACGLGLEFADARAVTIQ